MKTPPSRPANSRSGRGVRILILQSRFHDAVVAGLSLGALEYTAEVGATAEVHVAPGAFELPLLAQAAAGTGRYDAIVALGAVIKGETDHYDHIARESARGLMDAGLKTGIPIAFGVLTVTKSAQALARSRPGLRNKGREAAAAAIAAALLILELTATRPRARRRK